MPSTMVEHHGRRKGPKLVLDNYVVRRGVIEESLKSHWCPYHQGFRINVVIGDVGTEVREGGGKDVSEKSRIITTGRCETGF